MLISKDTYPIARLCLISIALGISARAGAEPARTTWAGYLYQGPGYRFAVADELPQASSVEVGQCSNGWCQIEAGDRRGYVREEIIARGRLDRSGAGSLAQPAAIVRQALPSGPCVTADQTGGNGGNAPTIFCQRTSADK